LDAPEAVPAPPRSSIQVTRSIPDPPEAAPDSETVVPFVE
jgi:hypothetical protein